MAGARDRGMHRDGDLVKSLCGGGLSVSDRAVGFRMCSAGATAGVEKLRRRRLRGVVDDASGSENGVRGFRRRHRRCARVVRGPNGDASGSEDDARGFVEGNAGACESCAAGEVTQAGGKMGGDLSRPSRERWSRARLES
jgi:hypothetical protein